MATPAVGSVEQAWAEAEAERAFWLRNHDRFMERYPDQFVVVHDNEVIATGTDLRELQATLASKGLQFSDTWVQYFEREPRTMML